MVDSLWASTSISKSCTTTPESLAVLADSVGPCLQSPAKGSLAKYMVDDMLVLLCFF